MRRGIAAGRLPASCTGNALLGSFSNMISSTLSGVTGTSTSAAGSPPNAGANMSGVFQGAGNWRLDFIDGAVNGYSTFSKRTATCPAINLTSNGASAGIQTMQMNVLKSGFGGDKGPPTPPGIRMQGIFAAASTGFSLQFFPESVVLGCGPISARASGGLIKIAAADRPLSVTIRADGSLDPGSGPYNVHGRMITGPTVSDNYTFLPLETTCNLAVLTPARNIPSSGGTTPHR